MTERANQNNLLELEFFCGLKYTIIMVTTQWNQIRSDSPECFLGQNVLMTYIRLPIARTVTRPSVEIARLFCLGDRDLKYLRFYESSRYGAFELSRAIFLID